MLLTLISTYMQNIICILLVHNLFLAANVCKYTVRYAVWLPFCVFYVGMKPRFGGEYKVGFHIFYHCFQFVDFVV